MDTDDPVAALADQQDELIQLVDALSEDELLTPSRCDGWTVADVLLHLAWSLLRIKQPAVQPSRPRPGHPIHDGSRFDKMLHQRGGVRGGEIGIIDSRPPRLRHLNHWRAVAHAHATDAFHHHLAAARSSAGVQRMEQLVAPFRHAARAETDMNDGWPVSDGR